jgi:hypothetical protein
MCSKLTEGLLAKVKVNPSDITPKAFNSDPYIRGKKKGSTVTRKDENEKGKGQAVQSAGGDGSSAPTPNDGDVGAGSSAQPPKQKTDDGREQFSPKLRKRLLLYAWSKTYGPVHDIGACSEADAILFGCGS